MNYAKEGYQQGISSAGAMIGGQAAITSRNLTVAENIDGRIQSLMEQIERLQVVKAKLSKGTILDVSLEDLSMAMGRY